MNRSVPAAALLLLGTWGCVYYNGLWNAHQYASDARKQERNGQVEAAIVSWSEAAVEAESVAARHPHSGWLPEALVSAAEGLAGANDCATAALYLARADSVRKDQALVERVALVRSRCALAAGYFGAAAALGTPVLDSKDAGRRHEAALLLGRAARRSGDPARAAILFAQSPERAAGVEQVLALIEAGEIDRADTLCDPLLKRRPSEDDWDSIFTAFAAARGPAFTSRVLSRVVPRARLTSGARARLYLDDGQRLLVGGDPAGADARFAQAAAAAPDSAEADQARVARLAARVARFTSVDSLAAVTAALSPYAEHGSGAAGARRLRQVLSQLQGPDTGVASAFRGGEIARDSLAARGLAAAMLLGFARRHPASLFAPKAILAALPLVPERSDSLTGVLDREYATSPYTLALRGAPSPGFTAAEDSLARLFGIRTAPPAARVRLVALWAVPGTGRRGPVLEPPEVAPIVVKRPPLAPGRRGAVADSTP